MMRSLVLSLSVSVVVLAGCSAKQPEVMCTASRAHFAVKYELVEGEMDCVSGLVHTNAAGDMGLGETLGVQSYVADPHKSGDGLGSMAIKSELAPLSEGRFTSLFPNDDEICEVKELPPSNEEMKPTYAWKNVKVLVNAEQPGTQFGGDLTYSGENCTATLKAVGISPVVECKKTEMAADGTETEVPDDEICTADDSGIAPGIAVECDKVLLVCVAKKSFPSKN